MEPISISCFLMSTLHAGVAFPDAPDLVFVGGLGVVGEHGSGEGAGGPAELDPFLGFPTFENAVEHAADKTIAAADTIEHADGARFDDVPFVAGSHDGAPKVMVGAFDFAQGGRVGLRVGIGFFDATNHFFKAFDLRFDVFAAGFGPLDAEAKLEIFFVADKDVSDAGDLGENRAQFFFATFPEGGAIIQVERDFGSMLFGGASEFETELAGFRRKRADQTGEVNNLDAFLGKNAVEVEIFDVERAADFAGAIVPNARAARTVAAVGNIKLMAITPGAALRNFFAFEIDMAAAQVVFDHLRDRAAFDEGGEDFDGQAEIGSDAGDVGFGAGDLHHESAAGMDGLAVRRGDAHTHARRDDQRVFAILFQFDLHVS